MRKRKRDWPQRVYKYHVTLTDPIPQELWNKAERQRQCWNDLRPLCAIAQGQSSAIGAKAKPLWRVAYNAGIEANEAARVAIWTAYRAHARELQDRHNLGWESDLVDRFNVSWITGLKKWVPGKGLALPRYRPFVDSVRLVHRFTEGGVVVGRLWSRRNWRVALTPSSHRVSYGARYQPRATDCRFGLSKDVTVRFFLVYHRPLPPDAIVKQVALCGRRNSDHKTWAWTLNVQVEVWQPSFSAAREIRIAGLDVGWRKIDEDTLRVGMLVDDEGRTIELCLPLNMPNKWTKRKRAEGRAALEGWRDLAIVQQKMDGLIELMKGQIRERKLIAEATLQKMRVSGLRQLANTSPEAAMLLRPALESWERKRFVCSKLRDRLIRRRDQLYRNLAAWLCRTYTHIAWEEELSLKDLAEEDEKQPGIAASMRYRMIASLYLLRRYFREAAAKNGTELLDGGTRDSTRLCNVCGVETQVDGVLRAVCPNGHGWDQDVNAARNLLASQTSTDGKQNQGLRNGTVGDDSQRLDIPTILQAVAIEVQ